MTSGTKVVLVVAGGALAIAALRTICVPVGSFREGLEDLSWGMTADSVESVLGPPNRICTSPKVDHLEVRGVDADPEATRASLASITAERWVYSERTPERPVPRSADPACAAPIMAAEIGFDADGRLRWLLREAEQTPVAFDPSVIQ